MKLKNIFKKKKPIKKYDCVCEMIHDQQRKRPNDVITGFCDKHKTSWY